MKNATIPKVLRAAIYIRVSTAEQSIHGKSLLAQQEYLENYAKQHNMAVVGVYADKGQTARKELKKRKEIHRLLDSVKRNEVDVILFWRMDRWFRSVSDFYKVQEVLDAHHCTWISASEENINMETREGRLNLNLVLTIGQNEVDTTSERVRFTIDNMIDNGRVIWGNNNLPLGYEIVEENGTKKIQKKESEAPMVEEFFNYFLSCRQKKKTILHMQQTFGIDFSYTMLRTMLSSEFYIGKYRQNKAYCPAYLTPEKWAEIQEVSKRNIKSTRSGRIYYFTSLVRCPICGQKLVGCGCSSIINRKTGETRSYSYYRCNRALIDNCCPFRYRLPQNLVEDYLLKHLDTEYYNYQLRTREISEKASIRTAHRPQKKIQDELDRLNYMYMKGRLKTDMYEKEYTRLSDELEASAAPLEPSAPDRSGIKKLLSQDFRAVYSSLDPEHRREFWQKIIRQIHINENGGIISVDFY